MFIFQTIEITKSYENFSNLHCEFDGLNIYFVYKYKEKNKAILTPNNDYSTKMMWSVEEIIDDDAHFIKIRFSALWKILQKRVIDQEKMLPTDVFDKRQLSKIQRLWSLNIKKTSLHKIMCRRSNTYQTKLREGVMAILGYHLYYIWS